MAKLNLLRTWKRHIFPTWNSLLTFLSFNAMKPGMLWYVQTCKSILRSTQWGKNSVSLHLLKTWIEFRYQCWCISSIANWRNIFEFSFELPFNFIGFNESTIEIFIWWRSPKCKNLIPFKLCLVSVFFFVSQYECSLFFSMILAISKRIHFIYS